MDYILTADSLWKSYKGFHALSGLTMRVPRGSIYGLVGRNGAGKTTLIRLICGLQAPTSGGFTLFGLDSRDKGIHKARRRMGRWWRPHPSTWTCSPPTTSRSSTGCWASPRMRG